MKNLKNSIVGGVIGTLVIGGGIIYYFDPQIAGNVFSNDQLTNETSSIIVDSSVIQQINDTSSDALASDQPLTLDKLPAKTSSKQKASSKNNSSTSALAVQNDEIQNVDQDNFSNSSTSFVANSARENIPAVDCRIPNIQTSVISRKIIFNEIAWMGSVSSSNEEWIEIKNISGGDIDLSDWELINSSGKIKKVFSAGDVISLGGLVLLS